MEHLTARGQPCEPGESNTAEWRFYCRLTGEDAN